MNEFHDRTSAGRLLAVELARMELDKPVVLALPRGGVPVAFEIAKVLKAPLDLLLVRKIGLPAQPELAAAAVVDGERVDIVLNDEVVAWAGLDKETIGALAQRELKEIERRRRIYLSNRQPTSVTGHTVILVDDGIATGTTVRAALKALARRGAAHLVLAVPVAPADTALSLRGDVDDVVSLLTPQSFFGIGEFYRDFHQLSDDEVLAYLREASHFASSSEEGEVDHSTS
ncbi:phosphoribosyltransferase [Microvirga terricola]|uniref:Phosphoribosyltransferase n=1 Tax=Microvirga terricola TaxID=2719797 RepID=A0ABX0V5C6_9HYPH|nr:phosphoribosyltransferase [Microvirga terricola]NIX75040.1 phosphoribosyltransferase [Microvirga terricola]